MLAAMLVTPIAGFINTSSRWLDYPYPRPGSEGLILYETLLVKQGGDIYAPITPQRFISGPYPPIYYYLTAPLLSPRLPDWSNPNFVFSIFRPGREISLLATLLAAALIPILVIFDGGYAARGRRAVLLAALGGTLGGALLLTLPQVLVWATRFRGDMLMIALTAAGLAAVAIGAATQNASTTSYLWLTLGALLFGAAIFTKQTALAGPLGAALYLLARDWKIGLAWCALLGIVIAVPFALIDLATGNWFFLKMVDYHSLPLSQSTLTRLLRFAFWDDQWPLILLAAGYTLFRAWGLGRAARSGTHRGLPLLIPGFVVAATATLPTGAVVGADHNHLLMPGLAICASVGALLAWLLNGLTSRSFQQNRLALACGGVAFALLALYLLFTYAPSPWYDPDLSMPSAAQQEQLRKIVANVQRNPGALFFSDDPGVLALAGKQTLYDDPFTMTALASQGRWDESYYLQMLREGKFSLLVLSCDVANSKGCRADTFTPGALRAINDGYRILFRDVLFTYVPK